MLAIEGFECAPAEPVDGQAGRSLAAQQSDVVVFDEQRSWTYMSARARAMRCYGEVDENARSERPRLLVLLEAVGGEIVVTEDGAASIEQRSSLESHLSVLPAGTKTRQRGHNITFVRDLTLEFDADAMTKATEGGHLKAENCFARRLMFNDVTSLRLSELLALECQPGRDSDRLYCDSLAIALAVQLSRLDTASTPSPHRGGLSPWQMRKAIEYLQSNLSSAVSLDELATLTRLSSSYFIRAFKQSTGVTPHQWHREARVKRACQLLVDQRWPLALIALETGFADQAHLTRVFREFKGESPGAWRRNRCGKSSAA
jgi:AraC family transcriptional regulator